MGLQTKEVRSEARVSYKRQREIFDPRDYEEKVVTIVGCGNIGSNAAIALGRLGIKNFILYDFDKVESHNLSSQHYSTAHSDMLKSEALTLQLEEINPEVSVTTINLKFNGDNCLSDILVIAVDSMKERIRIANNLSKSEMQPEWIIDGRMGGPQLEVYTCKTVKEWGETLIDGRVSRDPCGARYICYISFVIGAFIANQIKRVLKEQPYKKELTFNIDNYQLLS